MLRSIVRFLYTPSTTFLQSSRSKPKIMSPALHKGLAVSWDLDAKVIEDKTTSLTKRITEVYDTIAAAPTVSFKTVLEPVLDTHRWYWKEGSEVTLPRHVAVEKEVRDAATKATQLLEETSVQISMRVEVFQKLLAYREQEDSLSPELNRALDRLIKSGRRNGLHLSEEIRNRVKGLKTKMSELGIQFSKNLNEEKAVFLFSEEELTGMSASFLSGLEKEDGKYKVTLKYTDFFPITRLCRVPETRRKLELEFNSRCMTENTKILEELLELRQQEASLLGYINHNAYAQDLLMAKHPDTVAKFLSELGTKLQPLWATEKAEMIDLKRQECEKYGYEFNGKLDAWDTRYYANQVEEKTYAIDKEEIKKYFPLEVVTQGMLGIYQHILSLEFTLLPDVQTWHPDVQVFQVKDSKTSELMGYFYLDLHPREGKYGHACVVPMTLPCLNLEGEREPAVAAMLCNFPKPKPEAPSLLDHDEVETYFHEFGHVMHTMLSKTETGLFAGASGVEKDFVECPSQMLENWVWTKEPLKRMSSHYQTKEHLPDELIEKLVRSKKANAGGFNLRQVVLATFDQRIHSGGRCDTQKVYAETLKEFTGLEASSGTNMPATFNHMGSGYSGRYYSYLWSEVFSMDMFDTKFGEDKVLDPEVGGLYRERILQPGGSQDATQLLFNFLGRKPSQEPFLKSKGLAI